MKKTYMLAYVPNDGCYTIFSPDFPELVSHGYTIPECTDMGTDVLSLCITMRRNRGETLPEPADLSQCRKYIETYLKELEVVPDGEIRYGFIKEDDIEKVVESCRSSESQE